MRHADARSSAAKGPRITPELEAELERITLARPGRLGKPPSPRRELTERIALACLDLISIELASHLTGFTVEAIRARRAAGEWPDGQVFIVRGRTVYFCVSGYLSWVREGPAA